MTTGHLGGSVVEHLPLAQGIILGSWDQVTRIKILQGACFSLSPPLMLFLTISVTVYLSQIKSLRNKRTGIKSEEGVEGMHIKGVG